jgi:hypothetical protein
MSSAAASKIPLEKTIVLIVPAAGIGDEAGLRASLTQPGRTIRVLLCVPEDADLSLAASVAKSLAAIGTETQILLDAKAQSLGSGAFELHTPPDMSSGDQIEFALALSDVVLRADDFEPQLERAANSLQKPVVRLGAPLPPLFQSRTITDGLDPDQPSWLADWRWMFGRLEQAVNEVFAFGWLGWNKNGLAESAGGLKRCFRRDWPIDTHFALEEWHGLAPDRGALDASSPIVARFEAMDRSAVYGSYVHRDLIWVTYFLAAFAVLAAVAGALFDLHSPWTLLWGVVELVVLLIVLTLIVASRTFALRDRWTACRLGAEQLRIARMSLPLLVLPSALATAASAIEGHGSKQAEFGARALDEVKRAVRDHGLPRLAAFPGPSEAAAWVHCIIADQVRYHHHNHAKLERVERWLNYTTELLFVIALIAVVRHLWSHEPWLLLFTAAGPAFAAALHGAGTRLGIVHRAALSLEMEQALQQIDSHLVKLKDDAHSTEDPEREVRRLAFAAAEAMGSENRSWHVLVRRYRDELP